jgi:hypothetical protein
MPVGWTNLAPRDPFLEIADDRAHLRLVDLQALVNLLMSLDEALRAESSHHELIDSLSDEKGGEG